MNTWISEGVKARHWTCNALLGIVFVPLVLVDFVVSFSVLFDGGHFHPDMLLCFLFGIMTAIGACHLVLKNSLGGLRMAVSTVLMIPKNRVSALFRPERKGVFSKLHYELLAELVFGILFVYLQS